VTCQRSRHVDGTFRLALVLFPFYTTRIWGKADDLRLSVLMGLRRGPKLCRGMRRALSDDDQRKVAAAIVEHLETHNWKIEQGPVREGHSRLDGKCQT
jgi:hypothetical protein